MPGLLLDTCAVLWAFGGSTIDEAAAEAIERAAAQEALFISPISAWEIGMLASKGRIALTLPPEAWFARVLAASGVGLAAMTPAILVAASFLPGDPPADPADCIIAATARADGLVVVTRDRRLLSFGDSGHMRCLRC